MLHGNASILATSGGTLSRVLAEFRTWMVLRVWMFAGITGEMNIWIDEDLNLLQMLETVTVRHFQQMQLLES